MSTPSKGPGNKDPPEYSQMIFDKEAKTILQRQYYRAKIVFKTGDEAT